jgi:putative endonuclease
MKQKRSAILKQRDQRLGHSAENIAAWALRLKGFRIVARRWSGRHGEIDLIAKRKDLIIFVEVKARRDELAAWAAIGSTKRSRMTSAIGQWVGQHVPPGRFSYRVDAMLVLPWRWPRHVQNIMELGAL